MKMKKLKIQRKGLDFFKDCLGKINNSYENDKIRICNF